MGLCRVAVRKSTEEANEKDGKIQPDPQILFVLSGVFHLHVFFL